MDENRARALLRAERAEVATLLRDTEEEVKVDEQAPDIATDYGDASLPLTEGAEDEAVAAQLRDRLGAIDRALARLEAGTYGRSVLSGKPIPDQRLEADPAAELTVEEAKASRLCRRSRWSAGGLGTLGDPGGDLRTGPEAQLRHDVGDVPGDGGRTDHQLSGDGLVAPSPCDEPGDLKLPAGEPALRRRYRRRRDPRRAARARRPQGLLDCQVDGGLGGQGKPACPEQRSRALVKAADDAEVPVGASGGKRG
ncbi:MAG: DnaK suppressor protein, partial [Trebonia sp.]|nr:DnaK suppressor protein [Trebonia sp.]